MAVPDSAARPARPCWAGQPPLRCRPHPADPTMNLHLALTPLMSLLAGILILVMPKLLNLIVAVYLILVGLVGLFGSGALRLG
jgi:hypothetical protein